MRKVTNITVVIPTLDRPAELARCLDGLFKGTSLPAEVLIINQGQYHVVEPVIKSFQSQQSTPIIHCSQPPRGLSAARNLATNQAHCHIIAFTDDDCVPDPDWLAHIESVLISTPTADGVTGSIQIGRFKDVFFVQAGRTARNLRVGGETLTGTRELQDGARVEVLRAIQGG